MHIEITCPYCFEKFDHTEVHFRSDLVTRGECEYIPEEYSDIEEFIVRYQGDDKETILKNYEGWAFFNEVDDEKYVNFWTHSGDSSTGRVFDTTERNPADERDGITSYRRRILDPSDPAHWKYLKGGDPAAAVGLNSDGMVESLELHAGGKCGTRVCPHCHNPLPLDYGSHPVWFISIIGVTGSGKTVYLSQLLRGLENYAAKVGLSAIVGGSSPVNFLRGNPVREGMPLPGATPPKQLQQPLFYNLIRAAGGRKKTCTVVMYDIAGETCTEPEDIRKFGPFIEHSDGILLLVDPAQFKIIRDQHPSAIHSGAEATPTAVLQAIHHYVMKGNPAEKCPVPVAVCISKSDEDTIQDVLDPALGERILSNVGMLSDDAGRGIPQFNAAEFNPIASGLREFIADPDNEAALDTLLYNNYDCFTYFAFSSLGCGLKEDNTPEGPILPKRIEEPLFWLFSLFGLIGANEPVITFGAPKVLCPACRRHRNVEKLPDGERQRTVGKFLWKKTVKDTYHCRDCGCRW